MNLDAIPIWLLFMIIAAIVTASTELGQRLGTRARKKSRDGMDAPVSAISGSVLGLVAFMLAFTFGIVSNRYDARKHLVIDEANQIGTTYLRADFLPDPERDQTRSLLKEYTRQRLADVQRLRSGRTNEVQIATALEKYQDIQQRLWHMAVANSETAKEPKTLVLYIDSLNGLIDIHTERVAIGLQARVPDGIWFTLMSLIVLGMATVGYQMGIVGSKRSLVQAILAASFSLVICLIAMLDRPASSALQVSQQPFEDLLRTM